MPGQKISALPSATSLQAGDVIPMKRASGTAAPDYNVGITPQLLLSLSGLTADQQAALDGANNPGAGNPLATMDDLPPPDTAAPDYYHEVTDQPLNGGTTTGRLYPAAGKAYKFGLGQTINLSTPTGILGSSTIFALRVPAGAAPVLLRSVYTLDGQNIDPSNGGVFRSIAAGTSLVLGYDKTTTPATLFTAAEHREADTYAALAYASSIALDFNAATVRTLTLTGDVTFANTANKAQGKTKRVFLTADGTARALVFPSGWRFLGTKPTSLAAGKGAVLTLECLGPAETDVWAAYSAEA
jgi:hypothetical protein